MPIESIFSWHFISVFIFRKNWNLRHCWLTRPASSNFVYKNLSKNKNLTNLRIFKHHSESQKYFMELVHAEICEIGTYRKKRNCHHHYTLDTAKTWICIIEKNKESWFCHEVWQYGSPLAQFLIREVISIL